MLRALACARPVTMRPAHFDCPECHRTNPSAASFCEACGAGLHPCRDDEAATIAATRSFGSQPEPGEIIAGKYRIREELGRGGMGVVLGADDLQLGRTVALKFLPPSMAENREAGERFVREARAAAALDHPNICTVYEVGRAQQSTYIAMAYVEGRTLRDRMKLGGLAVPEALDIAVQAAEGLAEAHSKGVVHRDVKPANIMVRGNGRVKVMDFGLAKMVEEVSITREGTMLGTVSYMSPEQARGEAVDARTDVWSLGVVLYEMLAGVLPFRGDRDAAVLYAIANEEPRPLNELRPDIPPALHASVARAMLKNAADRYACAGAMLADLESVRASLVTGAGPRQDLRSLLYAVRRPVVAIPATLALLVLAVMLSWHLVRQARVRWAREVALPEIERRLDETPPGHGVVDGFRLLEIYEKAAAYAPDDPRVPQISERLARDASIRTTPPGARILVKEYARPDSPWRDLGTTPIERVRLPRSWFRWRIEKEGFEPLESAAGVPSWDPVNQAVGQAFGRVLQPKGSVPPGMVAIPGGKTVAGLLGDFLIDKFEVTNRAFKRFVDQGGYATKEYWKHPFVRAGKVMTWDEAMPLLVDATGRPGPATWEGGTYPAGQDDYPVSGVSWYEAAAYAEFAHKALPTSYDFTLASYCPIPLSARVPFTNLGGSKGPAGVGTYQSLTYYGVYDLVGNVREWCANDVAGGKCVRGGAWRDEFIWANNISGAEAFDRSPTNGFRCVQYPARDRVPDWAFAPLAVSSDWDYSKEKPVSDEVFEAYRQQFLYDKAALNATLDGRDASRPGWTLERISYDAAYGKERVQAVLLLPKSASPPYQVLVFFPGSNAVLTTSSANIDYEMSQVTFLVSAGRAVMMPIYKGTYERGDPAVYEDLHFAVRPTRAVTEYWVQLVKDFSRSVDYLETRKDIAPDKIGYLGFSWGGMMGGIVPAVEPRVRAVVLDMAGLCSRAGNAQEGLPEDAGRPRAEVDPFNYVPRVRVPTLVFSGRYDMVFPYETSARPFFDLLGSRDKKHVVTESDHATPTSVLIRETLAFLDRHLGPVSPRK